MTSRKKDDAVDGPSHVQSKDRLLGCYACMHKVTTSGHLRPLIPASEPKMKLDFPNQEQGMTAGVQQLCRCTLNLEDEHKLDLLRDSGSEEDEDQNVFDWDQESLSSGNSDDNIWMVFDSGERQSHEHLEWQESARIDGQVRCDSMSEDEYVTVEENVGHERIENEREARIGHPVNMDFFWSKDFTSFTGQKETYARVPGPTYSSQSPTDIFCEIWDRKFLENVAKETNEYAWQSISKLSDPDLNTSIPIYLDAWTEITVGELYRYFAVLIYMSFCHRSKISEYWDTGVMGMPLFRDIMSRNKFQLISKFLHFVNNENLVSNGYDRKISKVGPVIDHCNKKFADLYTPSQYLSLDDSLLLWKGRLSWTQCIRSKAARFGMKSFELCEAETGYLLQYRLYIGKDTAMHPGPLHGYSNTAKVVLQLLERYLDAGHVIVMDNWYNQLPLTRYLKSRRTDVLGTINRRQHNIPHAIKDLNPKNLKRGETIALHSGDISLVAWRDVKLVTLISTYHQHEMVLGTRAGHTFSRPAAVHEYNRYTGGVDVKDQKLSMFLMERKRNVKWYMKVFKRLFNTSLLNAFIIYTRNPIYRMYSHRQFRFKVAEELLRRNLLESSLPRSVPNRAKRLVRLEPGNHFPIHTEAVEGPQKMKHRQLRCVRCTAQKKRVLVTMKCKLCDVPLCVGKCWEDYHKLINL